MMEVSCGGLRAGTSGFARYLIALGKDEVASGLGRGGRWTFLCPEACGLQ